MANRGHIHGHFDHGSFAALKNLTDDEIALLPERERMVYEHHKMHEKHRDHEAMHLTMFLILIVICMLAQVGLLEWKRRRSYSYQIVTVFWLWVVPASLSVYLSWWRFVVTWFIFTAISGYIIFLASRKPVATTTPRLVYRWFLLIYQLSYVVGIAAYVLLFACLTGVNVLFMLPFASALDAFGLLLFYGLYYGVLGRDLAEVCGETMASNMGYYSKTGLPSRQLESSVCAVCGNSINICAQRQNGNTSLPDAPANVPVRDLRNTPNATAMLNRPSSTHPDDDALSDLHLVETACRLNCGHVFHDFCIRGWCIVGKKDTCPYCKERVDLRRLFPGPWDKPHMLYGQLLEWVRYLTAWQPIILVVVHGIYSIFQLE